MDMANASVEGYTLRPTPVPPRKARASLVRAFDCRRRGSEDLEDKAAALSKSKLRRRAGELPAAAPRRRAVADETGEDPGEVTLIGEAARRRDVSDAQRGILQFAFSHVDSMPLQPLMRREARRDSKSLREMPPRESARPRGIDQRDVVGTVSGEKFLGAIRLQPRHAAL